MSYFIDNRRSKSVTCGMCCSFRVLCVAAVAMFIASAVGDDVIPCDYPSEIAENTYWRSHDYHQKRMWLQRFAEERNGQKIRIEYYVRANYIGAHGPHMISVCASMSTPDPTFHHYLLVMDATYHCVRIFAQSRSTIMVYTSVPTASSTGSTCASQNYNDQPVEIFVRWWNMRDDVFNFKLERPCPFTEGKYHVTVRETRECESNKFSHAFITNSAIELQTCVPGNTYEKPFKNITLHCFGELPVSSIGSADEFGRVLVLGLQDLTEDEEFHAKFYVGRFHVNEKKEVQISIQGNMNGKLQPEKAWGAHSNQDNVLHDKFATSFHMRPFTCVTVGCDNKSPCEEAYPDEPTYYCVCQPGYTGRFCETNIDDCRPDSCHMGGTCIDSLNGFVCRCYRGFFGIYCEGFDCPKSRCEDHGRCAIRGGGKFYCTCDPGYTGRDCAINIDDCLSNPSCGHGTCVDGENQYTCECGAQHTGRHCETIIDIDYCMNINCNGHGTCTELDTDYVCNCDVGFTGKDCETDIDYCMNINCNDRGTCTELGTDYVCNCDAGFTGKDCETNIDYCMNINCNDHGTCIELYTDYVCNCDVGFTGKDCETDIDYCMNINCNDHGTCTKLDTDYVCNCDAGFTGKDCETNMIECNAEHCNGHGNCTDFENEVKCVCLDGNTGENCETDINKCSEVHCNDQGRCTDFENGVKCECFDGNTGENCETNINKCSEVHCNDQGRCTDFENGIKCECVDGYSGENCETDITKCSSMHCNDQGKCIRLENNTMKCECYDDNTGEKCETDVNKCGEVRCNDQGRCTDFESGVKCECDHDYTGDNCESAIVGCEEIDCSGHGDCVDSTSGYQCVCQSYYTGRQCETSTLLVTIAGYTGPLTEGATLNLTCRTNVQAKATYMWFLRTAEGSPRLAIAQNQTYRVAQVTTSDAGEYTCVVDIGSNSAEASVDVEVLTSGETQAIMAEAAEYAPIAGIAVALFAVFLVVTLVVVRRFQRSSSVAHKVEDESKKLEPKLDEIQETPIDV